MNNIVFTKEFPEKEINILDRNRKVLTNALFEELHKTNTDIEPLLYWQIKTHYNTAYHPWYLSWNLKGKGNYQEFGNDKRP